MHEYNETIIQETERDPLVVTKTFPDILPSRRSSFPKVLESHQIGNECFLITFRIILLRAAREPRAGITDNELIIANYRLAL